MTTIEDTKTEAAVVAELADLAAKNQRVAVATGEVYLIRGSEGELHVLDTDAYAKHPRRDTGARSVTDARSFVEYVNRHAHRGTEVYAHTNTSKVVAVIDSHEGAGLNPGWQKHRVSLDLEHSKSWLAWAAHDLGARKDTWFDQAGFADFIEQNALDVRSPDHGTLIDIATTFEAKQKADFSASLDRESGAVKFEYAETVGAKAGQKGGLTVPREIELALRPYIGGPVYKVIASFRYRTSGSGLRLGYALQRPEVILEAAFGDIVTEIRDGRHDKGEWPDHPGIGEVPIFNGRPSA